jgi:hypothetical protein
MSRCLIGMEACVGAHHLSRKLKALGHDARLMPAKYMRPYSKGQKNDFRDAEAIAEAVQRPTMKFVATKTAEQLDLQALHRVRERLGPISKSPEEDDEASQLDEAEEVLGVILPAHKYAALPLDPGEEAFYQRPRRPCCTTSKSENADGLPAALYRT